MKNHIKLFKNFKSNETQSGSDSLKEKVQFLDKLPTAEEFLDKEHKSFLEDIITGDYTDDINLVKSHVSEWLKEFAKLHCEAQLKAILDKSKTKVISEYEVIVDKDSILTAYSLDNIK